MADVLPLSAALRKALDRFRQLLIGGVGAAELVERPP